MSARSSVPRPVERLVTLASRAGAVAVVLCAAVACGSDAPPAYLTDLVDWIEFKRRIDTVIGSGGAHPHEPASPVTSAPTAGGSA